MMLILTFLLVIGVAFAVSNEEVRSILTNNIESSGFKTYSGYQVVRFKGLNQNEIKELENSLYFDIWDVDVDSVDSSLFSVVASVSKEQFAVVFMGDEYEYEILIEDLSSQIMSERSRLINRKQMKNIREEFFEDFRTYDEIHAYYQEMCSEYSSICSISILGRTGENRDILGVRLNGTASTNASPKLFFECSIHAREWISAPTCAWQLKQLLEGYANNDADARFILNTFTVLIVPIVNPDGYAYTWSNDRMWRKNRVSFTGSTCRGVDLNRNWPSHWASASNQCSDTYPGASAASELETKAIGTWIQNSGNVQFNIDFHAYGELILRPWGNTVTATPDESILKELGDGMRDAIRTVHNNLYTSQRSAQLYPADGETTDYYYDTVRVGTSGTKTKAWGFTFELRGNSFVIDADEIIPQGEEIWAGLVFAAEFVNENPVSI